MEFGYWDENFEKWKEFKENGVIAEVPKDGHDTIPRFIRLFVGMY